MDENREKRKRLRAVLSFVLMAVLLMVLFFAAINIGSLKVSFGELMRGLFVERIDEVATIYDLRFPRIIISMLAGAAIAFCFRRSLKTHWQTLVSLVFPVVPALRQF